MRNNKFDVRFDSKSGTIKSIVNPSDVHAMNWCEENGNRGCVDYVDILERCRTDNILPMVCL